MMLCSAGAGCGESEGADATDSAAPAEVSEKPREDADPPPPPDEPDADEAGTESGAPAAPAEEPAPEGETEAPPTPPEPALEDVEPPAPEIGSAQEQELIDSAIRARRIRALDILLVDAKRSKRSRFPKAETWCEKREIEGVRGWRLPTVGEISSLTLNGFVPRDYYWSGTKGDTFGDKMLVWNGKRKRIKPTTKRSRGARAVCVRTRDGRPPDENEMEVQIDE